MTHVLPLPLTFPVYTSSPHPPFLTHHHNCKSCCLMPNVAKVLILWHVCVSLYYAFMSMGHLYTHTHVHTRASHSPSSLSLSLPLSLLLCISLSLPPSPSLPPSLTSPHRPLITYHTHIPSSDVGVLLAPSFGSLSLPPSLSEGVGSCRGHNSAMPVPFSPLNVVSTHVSALQI